MKTVSSVTRFVIGGLVNDQPFHVALCREGPCSADRGMLEVLRGAVGRSRGGVLVSAGCLLGAPRCRQGAGPESGPVVIVQPSDAGGRPRGPAIIIGPVLAARDAETIAAWLAGEAMDRERLGSLLQQARFCAPRVDVLRRPAR
jgi:hypothetical protein